MAETNGDQPILITISTLLADGQENIEQGDEATIGAHVHVPVEQLPATRTRETAQEQNEGPDPASSIRTDVEVGSLEPVLDSAQSTRRDRQIDSPRCDLNSTLSNQQAAQGDSRTSVHGPARSHEQAVLVRPSSNVAEPAPQQHDQQQILSHQVFDSIQRIQSTQSSQSMLSQEMPVRALASTQGPEPQQHHLSESAQPSQVGDASSLPAQVGQTPSLSNSNLEGLDQQYAEEQSLEAEDDDADSALGSDTDSTTTSLSESIFHYRKEHGRTYHAYKDGKYIFPNDERESDRLDLQHHLFYLTFGGKLHLAPIERPRNAVDIGTGTGIWAVDFADQYPECQVIGIDLSPSQPTMVPPNLRFIVDDAEDAWVYAEKFDYIHLRLMAGCMSDWPNFFRQAFEYLEPGGWLELQDYGLPVKSADGTHEDTSLARWGELLCAAARRMGRPMGSDACELYEGQMRAAGFVAVQRRMFMWPSSGWPRDAYMKELGRWNMVNCLAGLEGFCLALLTRGLGWRREEVDVLVAQVTRDFKNRGIHAYFPMPVTFGRKPFEGELV